MSRGVPLPCTVYGVLALVLVCFCTVYVEFHLCFFSLFFSVICSLHFTLMDSFGCHSPCSLRSDLLHMPCLLHCVSPCAPIASLNCHSSHPSPLSNRCACLSLRDVGWRRGADGALVYYTYLFVRRSVGSFVCSDGDRSTIWLGHYGGEVVSVFVLRGIISIRNN